MASVFSLDEASRAGLFQDAAIAFGVFDGYHLGHRYLVEESIRRARRDGVRHVVLTFDVDPDELFRAESLKKLMTNDMRLRTLADSGTDAVVTLPFTRQFAQLDPYAFLDQTFKDTCPSSLHVGADFRFGCRGAGDVSDLRAWSQHVGTDIVAYQLLPVGGQPVTATRIRSELQLGHASEAAKLLGHPWTMEGVVEHGRGEGTDMGFATANLCVPASHQVIAEGVYAAYALVGERRYKAAVSVGASPTFTQATAVCEVHILNFDQDIYGRTMLVEFVEWLRPMRAFETVDELISTVKSNIEWVRVHL